MRREHIDVAIHAQLDRRTSLLRDVARSGGNDTWPHLFSHGHQFPTVLSAVRCGYLRQPKPYHYEITESGSRYLDEIEEAKARAS